MFRTVVLISALFVSLCGYSQNREITGIVTNEKGDPLISVSVSVKGTTKGTITDQDGSYAIDIPEQERTLIFSLVGYVTREITVGGKNTLDIVLKEESAELSEVVITAFGRKERREAVVGSVTSIEPDKLRVPSSNLTTALAGRIAGLIAYQRNGQPGQDDADFFIRGVTTFGYNNSPLILVDGVELTSTDLARMQPDDIESFSILKDASATAMYGARGANGVILIQTKEGREGKARVSIRLENSLSQPTQNIKLADPITYMRLYNEGITTRNPLSAPLFYEDEINNRIQGTDPYIYPSVDWLQELFKKRTSNQRGNLSVRGGGNVARYYIMGAFSQDNGILKVDPINNFNTNVNLQNYQLRSNININMTKSTEVVVRLSGNFDEYTGPITNDGSLATDLYNKAMHTSPVLFPAYYLPDSANLTSQHILFGNSRSGSSGGSLYSNPYADLMKGYKNYSRSRMSAQFELNQDLAYLIKGLTFRGLFNTNRYSYFDLTRQYKPFFYSINTYNSVTKEYTLNWLNHEPEAATEYLDYRPGAKVINTYLYFRGALDYDHSFGNHKVSASLVGTREQKLDANTSSLQESLPFRNLGLAGRATYSFNDKYFTEFNFGYNGSERFAKGHRFGFFPTIGAGWVVSNEKFWRGGITDIISRLKFRGSYGLVGNDNIGAQRFFYLSDVDMNVIDPVGFGLTKGYERNIVAIKSYENNEITWEIARKVNLAAEMTIFKDFKVIAEIYREHRYNILQPRTNIPASMGLEAVISANVGEVDSKGLDLSIDFTKNLSSGLWISGRGNLTLTSNRYKRYEEPQYPERWLYVNGTSIGQLFGYVAERLFVDDKEVANSPTQNFGNINLVMGGDIKYRDIDGDGEITTLDRVPIGHPTIPQLIYGFGISMGFKNFDLSAFFQGLGRESFFIDARATAPFVSNTQLLKAYADDHWSEQNQNLYALWPRLSNVSIENNTQRSSWWLRDGSFLRLKSLELGYSIPDNLIKWSHLRNARLYFNGLNLFSWSAFKLWDPEMGGNGFAYPIQKVYNVGIHVNF